MDASSANARVALVTGAGRGMDVTCPEDAAEVCAFLLTDAAEAISGQAIDISGAHEVR